MVAKTPAGWDMAIGSAEGFSDFAAFDGAPPAAGIGNAGLLTMSSILPLRARGVKPMSLPQGLLVPVACAPIASGESVAAISTGTTAALWE